MPVVEQVKIVTKEQLKNDIFKFAIYSEKMSQEALPGQFLEIRVNDDIEPFLRRPISIYKVDKEKGELEFIFQVKGKGTTILSQKQVGESINIMGPLGFGTFKYEGFNKIAIIGGGIGIFPLYELARRANQVADVTTYLGFRSKDFVLLEEEFAKVSNRLVVTTDDGSYGENGFAINYLKSDIEKEKPDCIYACGPLPMLRAVRELALEQEIPCQISLEERMGCGIGACLGCAVKKADSPKDAPEYFHVCKGGPVFSAKAVEI